jgi:hypothetical protein
MSHATFRSARAIHRQDDTQAGAIILAIASGLAAILVIAGLIYAAGTGARSAAAIAAAGCEPGSGSESAPCTTPAMLASQYTAILNPAARQMTLYAAAYTASETAHLTAARAALTAEVATMQNFDTSLAAITFPAAITPIASALIRTDQALAGLTAQQARAATLAKMRSYDHRIQAATATVRAEQNLLIKSLDKPV